MPLPTLKTEGNVVPQNWMNKKEKNKALHQIPLDYISDFISDRLPLRRGQNAKIKPKCMGDRVILLKSGTGSGKSTNIPSQLYYVFFEKLHKNIGITEPRRLTVETIPEDILEWQPQLKMGKNIGWQIKGIDRKPVKGIIFMTTGILVQQLKTLTNEEFMAKYMFILVDEFHERSIQIDDLLFRIKVFLEDNYDNPNCPMIILMSATFEKKPYMEYFDIPKENHIIVKGFAYPKKYIYERNPVNNVVERTIEIVKDIHTSKEGLNEVGIEGSMPAVPVDISAVPSAVPISGNEIRDIIIFVQSGTKIKEFEKKLHLLNLNKEFTIGGKILPIGIDSYLYNKGGKEYQNLLSPIETLKTKLLKQKKGNMQKQENMQKKGGMQNINPNLELWEKKEVEVT